MSDNFNISINEIFYSIQGEAKNTGKPTIFIRTAGCPFRCSYCDTEYAFSEGKKTSIDNMILDMRASFDYLLLKLNKKENPVNDILNNDKLTIGTIYLLFFIGGLTLILSGLMKE